MTISHEYAEELGRQVDELEAENERLRSSLGDCVAFMKGHISGPAQKSGIIAEAEAALQHS